MVAIWFIPFVIIAVMAVSAVLFAGWLAVTLLKGMAWLVGGLLLGPLIFSRHDVRGGTCRKCGQANPQGARFCRRCGKGIQ